jgi:predicted nucleotidyltransferase
MRTLTALFTSGVRLKALRRLALSGVRRIPERDLAREEDLPLGAMRRELRRLARAGLVRTGLARRRRLYWANTGHPYYPELKALLVKEAFLEDKLHKLGEIREKVRLAFVFGSTARGEEDEQSDLDLAVVGRASGAELLDLLDPRAGNLPQELNPIVYSPEEFALKYREKGGFVERIVKARKIFIVGSEDDLRQILEGEAAG